MSRFLRTQSALDDATRELEGASAIALDTEFHLERRHYPELMLLQLRGDAGEALLVDALAGLDLAGLGEVLRTRDVVVHGGVTDAQVLRRALGVRINVVFDTQVAAGFAGAGFPLRLQELARRYLGHHMPKTETLSDWSRRPLSVDQCTYAADDVLVLGGLREALAARVEERGHGPLFQACLAELFDHAGEEEPPEEAWRQLNGAALLDDRDRSALRELAAWRLRQAQARDVPRHTLASDGVLLDIARRQPRSIDALRANRRMPGHVWKKEGEAILACLERAARAEPPPAMVVGPRGWADLVRAAARCVELRTGVAVELLLTEGVWSSLARGAAIDGWRGRVLAGEFGEFLAGRAAIEMPRDWRLFTTP